MREAISLYNDGFDFKGKKFKFIIKAFVCDSPARSFILCTIGHCGYYGCYFCMQRGEWLGRVIMPLTNSKLRTDESFRNRVQRKHHSKDGRRSILENIPYLDMVLDFPNDPMHLVPLGAVKKLVFHWLFGKPPVKLSFQQIVSVSTHLEYLKDFIPLEYARKPRSLKYVHSFKATEFSLLLSVTGIVVFRTVLPTKAFKNHLILHLIYRLLSSKRLLSKFSTRYSKKLSVQFIEQCIALYGLQFIIYCIHNIYHLPDHVDRFGPIPFWWAFPFENDMQEYKAMLKKDAQPLEQI